MLRLYNRTAHFVLLKSRVGFYRGSALALAKTYFSASNCLALEDIQVISIILQDLYY